MAIEECLCLMNGSRIPAAFLPDGDGDLARTDLVEQGRNCITQSLCLMADLRTNKNEKRDQHDHEKSVNHADTGGTAVSPLFDPGDGRFHEISEENREEKGDQSAAGDIEEG